ncbi:MAG: alpha-L-fucosidase [Pseudomonadota bacterium]
MTRTLFSRRQFTLAGTSCAGLALSGCGGQGGSQTMVYQPAIESLNQHKVPRWFDDAKYGIFIHWGPYSVPAFAPKRADQVMSGTEEGFKYNPYAEWYLNTMLFEDGPTAAFHRETFGEGYSYDQFGQAFNEALDDWQPDEWARTFKRSGARYVVLVSKHHDGFLLWPSATPNPHKPNWFASRDIVGELAEAVRAQGLRFGIYYSGGVDWTFKHKRIETFQDLFMAMPGHEEGYTDYANAHYRELIERYRPDYLWNDIGYPTDADAFDVLANYYNTVPDGLTNDRWMSPAGLADPEAFARPEGVTGLIPPEPPVWDVRTPEYGTFDRVLPFKWEMTRGLGKSFGYNREESEADLLNAEEIITTLAQASAFGGNFLLNVGPRGDAQLDTHQVSRLNEVGDWLAQNGRYFQDAQAVALQDRFAGSTRVGATTDGTRLFVHLLDANPDAELELPLPDAWAGASAELVDAEDGAVALEGRRLKLLAAEWPLRPVQTLILARSV